MMNVFDSGTLYVTPADGSGPRRIGAMQEIELDFDLALKAVRTQYQMPVRHTQTLQAIHGRAKYAKIDGRAFGELAFGKTGQAGSRVAVLNTAFTLGTTFTPTLPGGASFALDLGAINQATGQPYTLTQGTPAAGQYKQAAGVYTFAAADAGQKALVSYAYDATSGIKVAVNADWTHFAPEYSVFLTTTFNSKPASLWLPAISTSRLALPLRLEQYEITELTFEVQSARDGSLGIFSFNE